VEDLQNLHKKNVFETSRVASCSVKPISRRTICRVLHRLNSKEGQTADAKAVATEDKLNSLSISAAHSVIAPLSTPHLAVNADTTSSSTRSGRCYSTRLLRSIRKRSCCRVYQSVGIQGVIMNNEFGI
jgi:hypothetical protein